MALPDETTIFCSRCNVYNIGEECCICKRCVGDLIDEWLNECDKLFETEDINNLKKKFGISEADE